MSYAHDHASLGFAEIMLSLRTEKRRVSEDFEDMQGNSKRVKLETDQRAHSEASSDTLCEFEPQRAESEESSETDLEEKAAPPPFIPNRTFTANVPIHKDYAGWYRRFPASSYFQPHDDAKLREQMEKSVPSGSSYNPPRSAFDLYRPRLTKGCGRSKQGVCPICIEKVERGGIGKTVFLSMKFSAMNYHLQYNHGISAVNGLPFSPPIAFRTVARPRPRTRERNEMDEGHCHHCKKWIALESVKVGTVKVKEIFWWKHAAQCHRGSTIEGETDIFIEDETYSCLLQYKPIVVEGEDEEAAEWNDDSPLTPLPSEYEDNNEPVKLELES